MHEFAQGIDDARRRADRAASRCEHCRRYVRWIENTTAAREGGRMQIVAQVVATSQWFEASEHRGLVAVFENGTGFTVSRFTPEPSVDGSWLYRCHWDVCDAAAAERDARSKLGAERRAGARHREYVRQFDAAAARYHQWRAENDER